MHDDNPHDRNSHGSLLPARLFFALALVAVVGFSVTVLQRQFLWLLNVVPDDLFYYLRVGENLARSGASTFDGVNPTNGYHPGWMLIVTLLAKLFSDKVGLLYGDLAASLMLHIATGMLLVVPLGRLCGRFWGWIGGGCWLLNPFFLLLALHGVETSLYLLSLALLITVYLDRIPLPLLASPPFDPSVRDLMMVGFLLGIAFLCRTDTILLMLALVPCLLYGRRRSGSSGLSFSSSLRILLPIGGTVLLTVIPWLIYSYAIVGTLVQDSGAMKAIWASERRGGEDWHTMIAGLFDFLRFNWLGVPIGGLFDPRMHGRSLLVLLGFLLIGGAIYRLSRSQRPPAYRPMLHITIWLGSTMMAGGIVYGLFIEDIRIWHMGLSGFILFILLFGWGTLAIELSLRRRSGGRRLGWGGGIAGAFLLLFLHFWGNVPELYPWQSRMYTSQARFDSLVPPGATVGCFNAGIPAYFGSRPVVNIDGLVNHNVLPYWRQRRFQEFLRDNRIDYIIDTQRPLDRAVRFSSAPVSYRPLDSLVLLDEWQMDRYFLWKIDAGRSR